ncbi:P-loop containing nucleoside triphosphate hydrolase protein [Viridothelium virens]|uniref:Ribosome-releasing factor 2, mitochondrial n=1 Tax=Viridothelium virens TaxID=1048519 RepID=A0A6A6GTA6_VIRVR|nr:P-loop containing nucleoside triphosphate hydrolase protein [Viridothelium virens]
MLYYSGFTRRLGDVDEGSTVTDFLPAERARGITIQSAAITFHWPPGDIRNNEATEAQGLPRSALPHTINLIDTPGHADFTFEVLRSLRILDGAVCILDGVAGVEAQTEHVWNQASTYQIPRIIFVNKLDRDGAAFAKTVREIGTRLHGWPAVCQFPWFKNGTGKLQGVADVLRLRAMLWQEGSDGRSVNCINMSDLEEMDANLAKELRRARTALIELLSEHDDQMVEHFLEQDEDHLKIAPEQIIESLRRCVLHRPQSIIPVFAGASFRNIGVQPLLDAVVDLLPSPLESPDPETTLASTKVGLNALINGEIAFPEHSSVVPGGSRKGAVAKRATMSIKNLEACALAFKVVHDARRGVLVYVRVYSGSLNRNSLLFNTNLNVSERAQRLLRMYASDAVEIDTIQTGQIGVIPGLKYARTGDTLVSYTGANPKSGLPAPLNTLQLRPIEVPPPVFFTSVEPNSLSEAKNITESLALLLREDPSLNVSLDPESGQTHLAGMGELHLEIARDRLINDLKAKAAIGAIEIGYREKILGPSSPCNRSFDKDVAGKPSRASCTVVVSPSGSPLKSPRSEHGAIMHNVPLPDSNSLIINRLVTSEEEQPISPDRSLSPTGVSLTMVLSALENGVSTALARGPKFNYPVHSTHISLTLDTAHDLAETSTPTALSGAARIAVQNALEEASKIHDSQLMEPVMLVTISLDEASLGSVVHDLNSARGGQVLSLDAGHETPSSNGSSGKDVMADHETPTMNPRQIYAPPDPFESSTTAEIVGSDAGRRRQVTARVPLKEMVGYLKHLRSLTGGRGTFVMKVDSFEAMSAQRQKAVLSEMRGENVY